VLQDSGIVHLSVEDQDKVVGGLGTPSSTDKVDRGGGRFRVLLANGSLQSPNDAGSIMGAGTDLSESHRSWAADDGEFGRSEGFERLTRGGGRARDCICAGNVCGDQAVFGLTVSGRRTPNCVW
jgi:hypothetical protein